MAELLLDKDVLVLISSNASERIEHAQTTLFKTCENTCGVHIRFVNCFRDLRGLEKEQRAIVLFIYDTFESEKKTKSSAALDALKIIQDAMKTRNNEIHALFSFPREKCDDFINTLRRSSLKFAVYDLSTMQECKMRQKWLFH